MNALISKYFLYYPVTLFKGERVLKYLDDYKKFQYFSRDAIGHYQLNHLKKPYNACSK